MSYYDTTRLPQQLRSLVESELQSGERITWMEQPIPGRMVRIILPIVLFGIPWTAFALFWTASVAWGTSIMGEGAGLFSALSLFGLPFIFIDLGMLSSPYSGHSSRRSVACMCSLTDMRYCS